MTMLADSVDAVIGVDTHTDTHTACMLDYLGRQISVITIPADPEAAGRRLPGPAAALRARGWPGRWKEPARTAWD